MTVSTLWAASASYPFVEGAAPRHKPSSTTSKLWIPGNSKSESGPVARATIVATKIDPLPIMRTAAMVIATARRPRRHLPHEDLQAAAGSPSRFDRTPHSFASSSAGPAVPP
jgi:hypothetical protein